MCGTVNLARFDSIRLVEVRRRQLGSLARRATSRRTMFFSAVFDGALPSDTSIRAKTLRSEDRFLDSAVTSDCPSGPELHSGCVHNPVQDHPDVADEDACGPSSPPLVKVAGDRVVGDLK
jgi:hypothetical protein